MAVPIPDVLTPRSGKLQGQRDRDNMTAFSSKYNNLVSFHARQFSPGCSKDGAISRLRLSKRICEKMLCRLGDEYGLTRRRLYKVQNDCVREIELCRIFVVKAGGVPLIADRICVIEKELDLCLQDQAERGMQENNTAATNARSNPWEALLMRQFKARRDDAKVAAAARRGLATSPPRSVLNVADETSSNRTTGDDQSFKRPTSTEFKAFKSSPRSRARWPAPKSRSLMAFVEALKRAVEEREPRAARPKITSNDDADDESDEYSESDYGSEAPECRTGSNKGCCRDSGYHTDDPATRSSKA